MKRSRWSRPMTVAPVGRMGMTLNLEWVGVGNSPHPVALLLHLVSKFVLLMFVLGLYKPYSY